MRIDRFDFALPSSRIALRPAEPRDSARMLVVPPDGPFTDAHVSDLPSWLEAGDCLVVNDTRVIKAQLSGRRGDAKVAVTLHEHQGRGCWRAFAKPLKRLKTGDVVQFAAGFSATVAARTAREVVLDFAMDDSDLLQKLDELGEVPLPPYIRSKRAEDRDDKAAYQTIYAKHDGAVAAPTAGLHFTEALFGKLAARGLQQVSLTLHVGAGTFLPVTVDDTDDHVMHEERITLSAAAAERLNAARAAGGRIVAVGTTSLRVLESVADAEGRFQAYSGKTGIFITPGYRFRGCDLLMTNFHLPRSTLFMLVSAFSGLPRMQEAYAHAIAGDYRFYSYGDACLLFPTAAALGRA